MSTVSGGGVVRADVPPRLRRNSGFFLFSFLPRKLRARAYQLWSFGVSKEEEEEEEEEENE